jgi:hypothetical protein
MHCSVELRSQFASHALIFCYTLIPCCTSCGTSYRHLASPLPQLSILLFLDYGLYSGLGLRCRRSRYVSSMRSGCVSPCCVLAGASRFVTSERLPREDAIWPQTQGTCRMGWRWRVLALGPLRAESTYHQMQYLLSYKPPALLWAGVRGETCSGQRPSCR